ncbi:MAG: AAA family ATPase, partial [Acidimicrobiia bacterium]
MSAASADALWEHLVARPEPITQLRRSAAHPVHAYLLAGAAGSGTAEAARRFAAAMVCPDGGCGTCSACRRATSGRHPDVVEVEPEGTFIVVGQIEEVIREASRSPFEAPRKVIVLSEADRMNDTAANKLLKTLEEPPARTHFVLLSDAPDDLIPTVRSRLARVDFPALGDQTVIDALRGDGASADEAAEVARHSAGR